MIDPSVPRISITELRRHFSRFIGEAQQGRIFVITRRGRDVAVLVPAGRFADEDLHQ
ncbi:type II toxin-antitoxin system Phd/YefM family antitoxin [Mycobacterium sp. Aquia_216]|uniref:type II toxin-antitoxin system Phd/YefM family antitoxin n=1 Tax=Mycobacterium sp. Aquia_216 TaxID=2991729 RepID=UPI00227A7A53|nr:type II toxin-antitoxin system Phd/YefM family antitoxin [Mycobacterium sp. Aquia_216]WAJ42852.1 type II toxin-antitoxin system Phd/YefM family antitoxin [Mycobacterium sp. Aquia_216]